MEDEEARKKKQKSYWDWFCGVFWLIAIPVAAIIAGGILLSIGVGQKNRLEGINAQEDFIMLKELCPVTDFAYTGRKQETGDKGKKTGCLDKYIYTFNADQLSSEDEFYGGRDNYLFRSFEHFQRRECQDCNRCDVLPPKFTAGEETECWRPAVPDIKSPEGQLNTWYRCGNDDCIKMFPPQDDEDRGRLISKSLWLAGVITLSVGGPLLVICVIILIFFCEKPTGPSPYKTGTPYQPHSAPNDLHLQPEEKKDTFYDSTPPPPPTSPYDLGKDDKAQNGGAGASLFDQMNAKV